MYISSTNKWIGFVVIASMIVSPIYYIIGPIPQPLTYHHFADLRTLWGIPYAMDVLSNIAFFIAGVYGIYQVRQISQKTLAPAIYGMYYIFFITIVLTAFSSGYYHLNPNNLTLFADRFTIAIATVALMNAIILERARFKYDAFIYTIFILLGTLSVVYWEYSEMQGHGDLRLYGIVQTLPFLVIIIMGWRNPKAYPGIQYLIIAFLFFILMRIFESTDKAVFTITQHYISGHTLKHIFAGFGVIFVAEYVRARRIPVR